MTDSAAAHGYTGKICALTGGAWHESVVLALAGKVSADLRGVIK